MTQADFPTEHHRRLNVLAGAWDTSITVIEADGTEGGISRGSDLYKWMPNRQFLVHEVDAMMGDQRVQSTEIFGVDHTSGDFFSRSYDPDGSTNDFVSKIDGLHYTITGTVQRFTGQFSDESRTLQGQWSQLSGDQWLPFVRIVLTKRS